MTPAHTIYELKQILKGSQGVEIVKRRFFQSAMDHIDIIENKSAPQLFTREQMKEAFHKGIAFFSSPRGYPDFETYMNTNYPQK
jgi:hypothetical protein